MCNCNLQHSGELRVADTSLLPSCAHGARPDADLDDVRPGEQQLLHHLPRDHVAGEDGVVGEGGPHLPHIHHEMLGVPIGNILKIKMF